MGVTVIELPDDLPNDIDYGFFIIDEIAISNLSRNGIGSFHHVWEKIAFESEISIYQGNWRFDFNRRIPNITRITEPRLSADRGQKAAAAAKANVSNSK